MSNLAVIVAAGSSRRMGFDKLRAKLHHIPVLGHSLLAFERSEEVAGIVLVVPAGQVGEFEDLALACGIRKMVAVVEGGADRCLSVWQGVRTAMKEGADTEIILVHDGARPLVAVEAIGQCIRKAREYGAASLAHRVTDTLKRADNVPSVAESVDRDQLWAMETPQAFEADLIGRASRAAVDDAVMVTDEVSAVQRLDEGQRIFLVENSSPNPKITYPGDLAVAAALFQSERPSP